MKTINIKGINFELCGTTTRNVVKQRSLYDCYANPSETKRAIWYNILFGSFQCNNIEK